MSAELPPLAPGAVLSGVGQSGSAHRLTVTRLLSARVAVVTPGPLVARRDEFRDARGVRAALARAARVQALPAGALVHAPVDALAARRAVVVLTPLAADGPIAYRASRAPRAAARLVANVAGALEAMLHAGLGAHGGVALEHVLLVRGAGRLLGGEGGGSEAGDVRDLGKVLFELVGGGKWRYGVRDMPGPPEIRRVLKMVLLGGDMELVAFRYELAAARGLVPVCERALKPKPAAIVEKNVAFLSEDLNSTRPPPREERRRVEEALSVVAEAKAVVVQQQPADSVGGEVTPAQHAEAVVNITENSLDAPGLEDLRLVVDHAASHPPSQRAVYAVLFKRPIARKPVVALKTCVLLHALLVPSHDFAVLTVANDGFLNWIETEWSTERLAGKNARREFAACFAQTADPSVYAHFLRRKAAFHRDFATAFSPAWELLPDSETSLALRYGQAVKGMLEILEALAGLLQGFAAARDEALRVKAFAVPRVALELSGATNAVLALYGRMAAGAERDSFVAPIRTAIARSKYALATANAAREALGLPLDINLGVAESAQKKEAEAAPVKERKKKKKKEKGVKSKKKSKDEVGANGEEADSSTPDQSTVPVVNGIASAGESRDLNGSDSHENGHSETLQSGYPAPSIAGFSSMPATSTIATESRRKGEPFDADTVNVARSGGHLNGAYDDGTTTNGSVADTESSGMSSRRRGASAVGQSQTGPRSSTNGSSQASTVTSRRTDDRGGQSRASKSVRDSKRGRGRRDDASESDDMSGSSEYDSESGSDSDSTSADDTYYRNGSSRRGDHSASQSDVSRVSKDRHGKKGKRDTRRASSSYLRDDRSDSLTSSESERESDYSDSDDDSHVKSKRKRSSSSKKSSAHKVDKDKASNGGKDSSAKTGKKDKASRESSRRESKAATTRVATTASAPAKKEVKKEEAPRGSAAALAAAASGRKTPRMDPRYELMPHEIRLGDQIGSGGFGVVFRGKFKGETVAIKKIHSTALSNPGSIAEFQAEVAVLCTLDHPNILKFMGACIKPPNLMIVTEFMARGTLFDVLHQSSMKVTWPMRRKMALDTCKGMRYLHDSKLLHRDLKSSNLMLDNEFNCKVGDMGLARTSRGAIAAQMTGQCGTFQYMAVEVLSNKPYSEKADVFSFGILLWEIIARQLPYFGMAPMQVGLAVTQQGMRPKIPLKCPEPLSKLMKACWHENPNRRPSMGQVQQILEAMPDA